MERSLNTSRACRIFPAVMPSFADWRIGRIKHIFFRRVTSRLLGCRAVAGWQDAVRVLGQGLGWCRVAWTRAAGWERRGLTDVSRGEDLGKESLRARRLRVTPATRARPSLPPVA